MAILVYAKLVFNPPHPPRWSCLVRRCLFVASTSSSSSLAHSLLVGLGINSFVCMSFWLSLAEEERLLTVRHTPEWDGQIDRETDRHSVGQDDRNSQLGQWLYVWSGMPLNPYLDRGIEVQTDIRFVFFRNRFFSFLSLPHPSIHPLVDDDDDPCPEY